MVLKLPWGLKGIFWAFWNDVFLFSGIFWVPKLHLFIGKARQSDKICFNQNLVWWNILKNAFETTLRSKTNILNFWKWYFSVFANFWVTNLKLFSWKVRQSVHNYLNSRLVIGGILGNGFEVLKNEYSEPFDMTFFFFLQFLNKKVETIFWENEANRSNIFKWRFKYI